MLGLGAERPMVSAERKIIPLDAGGISVMSIGFFVEEDAAVVWRGPMLHKALKQFLEDVEWGELDFLLIDLPPGTGDVSMTLAQLLPTATFVIVTTPQPAAQRVARRAAEMANKVSLEISGVIENMSVFVTPQGERFTLFGEGGGRALAEELDVPLLASVPLTMPLREQSDAGMPLVASDPDDPAAQAIRHAARGLIALAPPPRVRSVAPVGMGDDDREAVVAAGAQLGDERHLAEQRYFELIGELLATTFAEQAIRRVVVAGEPRHVLDHADDLQVDLAGHVRGALRDLLRRRLRRRDDHDLGARQELRHRQRDVAGAGRHVDDEEVGIAPVDVGEELLERLVQHRAPPHDRLIFPRKEAHRDQRDPVGLGRDDHVVDDGRRTVDAEHAWHREAPDVGVDRRNPMPALCEGNREIGGDRRLPDATLARRDREHARTRIGEGIRPVLVAPLLPFSLVGVRVPTAVQLRGERSPLLVGHDREVDVDAAHVGERRYRVGDPLGDLGPQGASGNGQGDGHADVITLDRDAPNHLEIDDRLVDLGVLDGPEGVENVGLGGHWAAPGNFHYLRR